MQKSRQNGEPKTLEPLACIWQVAAGALLLPVKAIVEAKLAHDLRKCRSSGILNKAAEAEIDELHWIWLREREAEAMERNAAAQDSRRDAAEARKTRRCLK
jgi:hypothetical protein